MPDTITVPTEECRLSLAREFQAAFLAYNGDPRFVRWYTPPREAQPDEEAEVLKTKAEAKRDRRRLRNLGIQAGSIAPEYARTLLDRGAA